MSIIGDLFPAKNRKAAVVAFIRTFWQAVTGSSIVATIGGSLATAAGLVHVDWAGLGWAALSVVAIGVLSGVKAGGNILVNGLPATYVSLVSPPETPEAK